MASSSKTEAATVLLDANILIYSASRPFDISYQLRAAGFSRIKVPAVVLRELKRLASHGTKKVSRFATLALEISKSFDIAELPFDEMSADDQLVRAATEMRCVVATTDATMRRRLRIGGSSVIFLKNGRLVAETSLITK
jgi:rRNA-processing protein FCF1